MEHNIKFKLYQEIISKYGSPVFLYHTQHIKDQYNKLKKSFSAINTGIHYAMKANSNLNILKIILELGGGIDAVSLKEVEIAIETGFAKEKIIYTPSCVSIEEIEQVMSKNVIIHFGAMEYLELLGEKLRGKEIGIRINPAIEIEGNQKIITSHQNSKFGIPDKFLNKVTKLEKKYGFEIIGLHIHLGSNIKNTEKLIKSTKNQFSYIPYFKNLKYLDLGGGLKVKYHRDDEEFDLEEYAEFINNELQNLKYEIEIKIEPGKFLVANSGFLMTKANIVKQGHSKKYVGINSGFNHLIRPMYYEAYHEIVNISNPNGKLEKYDIVGQLCEEDTFAYDREINEVRIGDIIVIESAGAYAFSMAMEYNMREKPKEIFIDGNNYFE